MSLTADRGHSIVVTTERPRVLSAGHHHRSTRSARNVFHLLGPPTGSISNHAAPGWRCCTAGTSSGPARRPVAGSPDHLVVTSRPRPACGGLGAAGQQRPHQGVPEREHQQDCEEPGGTRSPRRSFPGQRRHREQLSDEEEQRHAEQHAGASGWASRCAAPQVPVALSSQALPEVAYPRRKHRPLPTGKGQKSGTARKRSRSAPMVPAFREEGL